MKRKAIKTPIFPAILLLILLFNYACVQQKNRFMSYPLSRFYDQCEPAQTEIETTPFLDPGERFSVAIPSKWGIREVYADTMYGIVAANVEEAGQGIDKLLTFSVSAFTWEDSLVKYLRKEIRSMQKDRDFLINELGKINFNGRDSWWIMFETLDSGATFSSVVVYTKEKDELFLLQTSVLKTEDYRQKLCNMKTLVNSFEINKR